MRLDPPPLDNSRTRAELRGDGRPDHHARRASAASRRCGSSPTCSAPACISVDHPRFLQFVPAAPTEASILFDLVVGASSIYAGSWLEGGGAVYAENEALRWISRSGRPAGRPPAGCSSAAARPATSAADRRPVPLAPPGRRRARPHPRAARGVQRRALQRRARRPGRWTPTSSSVPADEHGRMRGSGPRDDARRALEPTIGDRLFAIVATAARPTPA